MILPPPPGPNPNNIGDQLARALAMTIAMRQQQQDREYQKEKMKFDLAHMAHQERIDKQTEMDNRMQQDRQQAEFAFRMLSGQPAPVNDISNGVGGIANLPPAANTLEAAMAGAGPVSLDPSQAAPMAPMTRPDMGQAQVLGQNPLIKLPGMDASVRPMTLEQKMAQKAQEDALALKMTEQESYARTSGANRALTEVPKPLNPDNQPRKLTQEEKAAYTELIKAGRIDPNGTYTSKQIDDFKSQFNADRSNQRQADAAAEAAATRAATAAERVANRTATIADKSYDKNYGELKKYADDANTGLARVQRLEETLAQENMVADSLVAPELLTAMAGGMGSGLRINEAEINRVVGGRPLVQDLRAKLQKIAGGDKSVSILPEERQKMKDLVAAIKGVAEVRNNLIDTTRDKLLENADKPALHKQIMADFNKKWSDSFLSEPATKTPPPVNAVGLKDGTIARKGNVSWVVKGGKWVLQ